MIKVGGFLRILGYSNQCSGSGSIHTFSVEAILLKILHREIYPYSPLQASPIPTVNKPSLKLGAILDKASS